MEKIDLSIIIVSWNSEKPLRACLDSIYKQTSDIRFETIVIDNASQDETPRMVMNEFAKTKVIKNEKNLGFSKAVNQGILASSGKYIVLLNPDTIILDRALEQMVSFMDQNQNIGVLAPELVNQDGSTQASIRRFPQFWDQFLIVSKWQVFFPNAESLSRYYARDFNYSISQEVEQVMGACMMIRREVVDLIGVLDENFFIWFEDVDYCKRVFDQTDYKNYYYKIPQVMHILGDSFDKVSSVQKQKWYTKSLRYYMKKHGHTGAAFILTIMHPIFVLAGYFVNWYMTSKKGKKKVDQTRKDQRKA